MNLNRLVIASVAAAVLLATSMNLTAANGSTPGSGKIKHVVLISITACTLWISITARMA
jgi:hypothetical protein